MYKTHLYYNIDFPLCGDTIARVGQIGRATIRCTLTW